MALPKDKNNILYAAGNRHERRKRVAWKRGKYMRDKKKAAELNSDLRKDAIADRVERKQGAGACMRRLRGETQQRPG